METLSLKMNRRIREVVGSSTLAITAKAKELRAQGRDVVIFASGEPDFDTPETIKQAAVKALKEGKTKYTPSSGTLELRKAIAEKFQNENGLTYNPSQIVVSCGAKHSIFNLVQVLCDEGDEVLIPAPYWVSYPEMVKIAGGVPKFIPTSAETGFKITPGSLKSALTDKTRLLILNYPSNPTGMMYSKENLLPLAEICVKNNICVISDEIYEKLIFDTDEFTSMASLGKEIFDLTFTVNGVSKSHAMTGWRIGYSAGNAEIMEFVKRLQDHSTSNPASISQEGALQALKEPEEIVAAMRDKFRERRDAMASALDKIPGISYIKPQGAFYMFCDFSKLGDSTVVAQKILEETNVAVIPGDGFGAPGFLRLSFATSLERIQEGTRRIAEWVKKQ